MVAARRKQAVCRAATVVLTRPAGRNEALAQHLTAHGIHCVVLPALKLTPTKNPVPPPHDFDLVLFVSGFAAQCYLQSLQHTTWPRGVFAAGVGSGTRETIQRTGIVPPDATICPHEDSPQDSEALWQTLQAAQINPRRVLIVRGNTGRDWLRQQWQSTGAQVQEVIAYHREAAVWSDAQGQQLLDATAAPTPCALLITSAGGARAVDKNLRRLGLIRLWETCRVLTLHPRIADCVRQLRQAAGIAVEQPIVMTKPDAQAILQSLLAGN